jgi:hypothetical protein
MKLMQILLVILVFAGTIPIARAVWANRGTSLLHALIWTMIAWLAWGAAFLFDDGDGAALQPGRYVALCLTGCAGVAVMGARRPHVVAWNFVVLCLFAVMVWPLIETRLVGTTTFDGLRIVFVAGTLAVGVLNYLPTRLAPVAFLMTLAGAGEIIQVFAPTWAPGAAFVWDLLLTAVPWLAWSCWFRRDPFRSDFDRMWLDFRDRWGLVWGQRVREQFNHAAENAGWPIQLRWLGLRRLDDTDLDRPEFVELLAKTLQRFVD